MVKRTRNVAKEVALGARSARFCRKQSDTTGQSRLIGVFNKQVIAKIYEVPSGHMVPLHFRHGDEFHLVLSGQALSSTEADI